MPVLKHRKTGAVAVVASAVMMICAPQAFAGYGHGGSTNGSNTKASGDSDGNGNVSATAGAVVFDRSKNGSGDSAGPVTAASGNWTPPACYYAPKYTPDALQAYLEPIWSAESTGPQWDLEQRNKYVNGGVAKDFNKAKAGQGYWWDSYVTEGREGDPRALDCTKGIFWVDTGAAPPADIPEAITPEMLAQLAYAEIRVPSTKVDLAPAGTTKVNLPTWAWLDTARFRPVSVTASVPLLGVTATTTAEPVSLRIEPGTADAAAYPASGVCEIAGDHIGEAYAKGKAKETPPCGVKYLRSSGDGSYKLRATITWKIHWTGTGVADERSLPDGTFGADQDVVVQEIQSINR
jgi:enoyl reductase